MCVSKVYRSETIIVWRADDDDLFCWRSLRRELNHVGLVGVMWDTGRDAIASIGIGVQ